MRWVPHEYQSKAIEFMLMRGAAGLFLDPGLGKTAITLAVLEVLRAKKIVQAALIIAPLRPCYSVWPAEAQKWDDFKHLSVGILHGKEKGTTLRQKHDVYVINPEGLEWLFDELDKLGTWPFQMLVVDESSKFKNTSTKRFKLLKPRLKKFARRYILTGSPATNGLLNLFGQMYVMDCGATFGAYITRFRNDYFYPTGFNGYEWKLKPGADQLIYDKVAPRVLRMAASDYLELPELVERTIYVDLPPMVMKQYRQLETILRLELDKGSVTAVNAAAAALKCRQLANGGLYLDGFGKRWENIHNEKAEAVADLIEELEGQPALIAYDFRHDLDRLQRKLDHPPYIGSGVTAGRSKELVDQWNQGDLPVLLGHPQSMAHGLNMQEAGRAVIWHSLTYNLEDYEQFIRRIWRQGQKGRVFVYHIVARGTVDEAVLKTIKSKDRTQQAFLKALKDYLK